MYCSYLPNYWSIETSRDVGDVLESVLCGLDGEVEE